MAHVWYTNYTLPDDCQVWPKTITEGRTKSWLEDDYDTITYFVDGACRNNGLSNSKGACAYFSGPSRYNSWEDPAGRSTSQTAELGAIYGALCKARNHNENNIKILTDSKYAVNAIKVWPHVYWQTNTTDGIWRRGNGKDVANQQLLKRIQSKMRGMSVDIQYISRDKNQIADRLAKEKLRQL